MSKENISQEIRLNRIDQIRNYFIEEIKQNELIRKNQKMVRKTLDCRRNKNLCSNCSVKSIS